MPAPITDRAAALARLQGMLQYASEPALSETEVSDLLDRHVIATVWAVGTAVNVGDRVVPTVLNGWMYVCEIGGTTSSDTEPTWLTTDAWSQVEATGVQWRLCGLQPAEALWDLRAAAHQGWILKAGKVAGTGSVKAGRLSIDNSGVRESCLAQARLYAPVGVV